MSGAPDTLVDFHTGLKDLYDELGFTSEKHKASLDYLLTLMASSSNKEYVAFDSMGKVTSI